MQSLGADEVRRYARHILLPDVGGVGQQRLCASTVSVPIDAHTPEAVAALAYLAAAGVGTLVLEGEPHGSVSRAEVACGILYGVEDIGRSRVRAIARRIEHINPEVHVAAGASHRTDRDVATPLASVSVPMPGLGDWADSGRPSDRTAWAIAMGGLRAAKTLAQLLERRHPHDPVHMIHDLSS